MEHVLERWRTPLQEVGDDRLETTEYPSRWQTRYCIDAMLEHAVMHPIRHAFQLEEFNEARTSNGPRRTRRDKPQSRRKKRRRDHHEALDDYPRAVPIVERTFMSATGIRLTAIKYAANTITHTRSTTTAIPHG